MSDVAVWAQDAVNYTVGQLGSFPDNHILRKLNLFDDGYLCVKDARAEVGSQKKYKGDGLRLIRTIAASALKRKCGNCREYASVTFEWLYKKNCPYPIEWATYSVGDHAFVIINRPYTSEIKEPRTWGKECFVADAWSGKVVKSADYWSGMPGFRVSAPFVNFRLLHTDKAQITHSVAAG